MGALDLARVKKKMPTSKHGLDAAGIVHAPYGLSQQVGDAQHSELRYSLRDVRGDGDGVGDNHFLENAAGQALVSRRAEDGMRGASIHLPSALPVQLLCRVCDGSCGTRETHNPSDVSRLPSRGTRETVVPAHGYMRGVGGPPSHP